MMLLLSTSKVPNMSPVMKESGYGACGWPFRKYQVNQFRQEMPPEGGGMVNGGIPLLDVTVGTAPPAPPVAGVLSVDEEPFHARAALRARAPRRRPRTPAA